MTNADKVQGLTLENVVVSLNLRKQRYFNYGQIYVALSRATCLQGLHILGEIQSKHIKANPKVNEEYERSEDIKFHAQLFNSDVLALTETQLLANDSNVKIKENLEPFRILSSRSLHRQILQHGNCVKHNLELENYEYIPILNAIKFDLVDTRLRESRSVCKEKLQRFTVHGSIAIRYQ